MFFISCFFFLYFLLFWVIFCFISIFPPPPLCLDRFNRLSHWNPPFAVQRSTVINPKARRKTFPVMIGKIEKWSSISLTRNVMIEATAASTASGSPKSPSPSPCIPKRASRRSCMRPRPECGYFRGRKLFRDWLVSLASRKDRKTMAVWAMERSRRLPANSWPIVIPPRRRLSWLNSRTWLGVWSQWIKMPGYRCWSICVVWWMWRWKRTRFRGRDRTRNLWPFWRRPNPSKVFRKGNFIVISITFPPRNSATINFTIKCAFFNLKFSISFSFKNYSKKPEVFWTKSAFLYFSVQILIFSISKIYFKVIFHESVLHWPIFLIRIFSFFVFSKKKFQKNF